MRIYRTFLTTLLLIVALPNSLSAQAGTDEGPTPEEQRFWDMVLPYTDCTASSIGFIKTGWESYPDAWREVTAQNIEEVFGPELMFAVEEWTDQEILSFRARQVARIAVTCIDGLAEDEVADFRNQAYDMIVTEGDHDHNEGVLVRSIFDSQYRYLSDETDFPRDTYRQIVVASDAWGVDERVKRQILRAAIYRLLLTDLEIGDYSHELAQLHDNLVEPVIARMRQTRASSEEVGMWEDLLELLEQGSSLSTTTAHWRAKHMIHRFYNGAIVSYQNGQMVYTFEQGTGGVSVDDLIKQAEDVIATYQYEMDRDELTDDRHRYHLNGLGQLLIAVSSANASRAYELMMDAWIAATDRLHPNYSETHWMELAPYHRVVLEAAAANILGETMVPEDMARALTLVQWSSDAGLTSQGNAPSDAYTSATLCPDEHGEVQDCWYPIMSEIMVVIDWLARENLGTAYGQVDRETTMWMANLTAMFFSADASYSQLADEGEREHIIGIISTNLAAAGYDRLNTWFLGLARAVLGSSRENGAEFLDRAHDNLMAYTVSCLRSRVDVHFGALDIESTDCDVANELLPENRHQVSFNEHFQPNATEHTEPWRRQQQISEWMLRTDPDLCEEDEPCSYVYIERIIRVIQEDRAENSRGLRHECRIDESCCFFDRMGYFGTCSDRHPSEAEDVIVTREEVHAVIDSVLADGTMTVPSYYPED